MIRSHLASENILIILSHAFLIHKLSIYKSVMRRKFIWRHFDLPATKSYMHFFKIYNNSIRKLGFPGVSDRKESACNVGNLGSIPGSGRSPEKEMATHSSTLAWRIPWTKGPGRLQSIGLQRFQQDWVTNTHFHFIRKPLSRGRNWGLERLRNFPEVTQAKWDELKSLWVWFQILYL